jgi:hypothetical protein
VYFGFFDFCYRIIFFFFFAHLFLDIYPPPIFAKAITFALILQIEHAHKIHQKRHFITASFTNDCADGVAHSLLKETRTTSIILISSCQDCLLGQFDQSLQRGKKLSTTQAPTQSNRAIKLTSDFHTRSSASHEQFEKVSPKHTRPHSPRGRRRTLIRE